jgi:hypothetical protein
MPRIPIASPSLSLVPTEIRFLLKSKSILQNKVGTELASYFGLTRRLPPPGGGFLTGSFSY